MIRFQDLGFPFPGKMILVLMLLSGECVILNIGMMHKIVTLYFSIRSMLVRRSLQNFIQNNFSWNSSILI